MFNEEGTSKDWKYSRTTKSLEFNVAASQIGYGLRKQIYNV